MSRVGDRFVQCCTRLNHIPASVLCVFLYILQVAIINYYLVTYLGNGHYGWLCGDIIVLILLIVTIILSTRSLANGKASSDTEMYSIAWMTWLIMHSLLAGKVIVCFLKFSTELVEDSFFSPNTLKTAIALGSCLFLLLLSTQHDAPLTSERKKYINELTGTVFFDLLDTTDILEILFDKDERSGLGPGLEEVILAVATLNLLLPTVPLVTLSKTRFGHKKLSSRIVYIHRLLLILAINLPNLIVRLILWHGFSVGISPFTLKNIILIVMTFYEFYQHKLEKYEEHEREIEKEKENEHFDMKRANSSQPPPVDNFGSSNTSYANIQDRQRASWDRESPRRSSSNDYNRYSDHTDGGSSSQSSAHVTSV